MTKYLLFFLVMVSAISYAQSPASFKYQAVVRDAGGVLAVNKIVSIRTSLLAGSATGTSVYSEKQTLSTNDYGVVSLNIGSGTVLSGNFTAISWGTTTYFVKTELDINGGSTYVFMGTSQILSVPYALYAEKAGSSLSDHDTSATNEIQAISVTTNTLTLSKNGGSVNLTPYLDNTDNQALSLVGNTLQISGGNSVVITGAVDLDSDPTNELQTLAITTNTISISNGNYIVLPTDNDRDSLNERQNLSVLGKTISITKGNSILLNDNDSTNELQTLTLSQGSLKISNKNTVHLPDSSSTNELQTLALTQGSLKISSKNTIHLPDSSATNELQTISVTNDTLIHISDGNSAYINTSRSLKYPEGIDGTPVMLKDKSGSPISYTVPPGKNLYATTKWNNMAPPNMYGFPVFPSGSTLTFSNNNLLCGVLVNSTANVQIINAQITTSSVYTVPTGKTLYVKSFDGNAGNNTFNAKYINGDNSTFSATESAEILIFTEGTILNNNQAGTIFFTGYLK